MAIYPGAIPTATQIFTATDNITWVKASVFHNLRDELRAALTELGTNPSDAYATVKARLDALAGSIAPAGLISMWSGSIATIPTGWVLCDGNNGTPDLRDKFVVGAKQDDGGVAKTNITGALTQTGGDISHNHDGAVNNCDQLVEFEGGSGGGGSLATHDHDIVTDSHIPPYYALAYIMKT